MINSSSKLMTSADPLFEVFNEITARAAGPKRGRFAVRALASVVTLALAAWAAPALAAPAIPNPSFELGPPFATAPGYIIQNSPIPGWSTLNTTLVGLNPADGTSPLADNGAVPNGTRVVFLQSVGGITS